MCMYNLYMCAGRLRKANPSCALRALPAPAATGGRGETYSGDRLRRPHPLCTACRASRALDEKIACVLSTYGCMRGPAARVSGVSHAEFVCVPDCSYSEEQTDLDPKSRRQVLPRRLADHRQPGLDDCAGRSLGRPPRPAGGQQHLLVYSEPPALEHCPAQVALLHCVRQFLAQAAEDVGADDLGGAGEGRLHVASAGGDQPLARPSHRAHPPSHVPDSIARLCGKHEARPIECEPHPV
mmetsp:Transcript_10941/g.36283  ORF Transcript_10941/g.36283 Transcript_10941/m.36283 type:complete len:239 (+) Transcript_10941:60-776(+)